jgi:hypothetical protein
MREQAEAEVKLEVADLLWQELVEDTADVLAGLEVSLLAKRGNATRRAAAGNDAGTAPGAGMMMAAAGGRAAL